jgi:hypothetical protein
MEQWILGNYLIGTGEREFDTRTNRQLSFFFYPTVLKHFLRGFGQKSSSRSVGLPSDSTDKLEKEQQIHG